MHAALCATEELYKQVCEELSQKLQEVADAESVDQVFHLPSQCVLMAVSSRGRISPRFSILSVVEFHEIDYVQAMTHDLSFAVILLLLGMSKVPIRSAAAGRSIYR